MATSKRSRHEEEFYRNVERGVRIKEAKLVPKRPAKVDTEKMYSIEIIDRDKDSNKVKIHFVGYSSDFDEWSDGDQVINGEKPNQFGRLQPLFKPGEESLSDRASVFFSYLAKDIKNSLYSSKKESPDIRIEERIDMDIYQQYLFKIGVITKSRGRNVHVVYNNIGDLCDILGNKWYERILNINGDFCYVIPQTVTFWLHEKKAVKEFFYVGDNLLENHIGNDLQLIFTFVRGDGYKQTITQMYGNKILATLILLTYNLTLTHR